MSQTPFPFLAEIGGQTWYAEVYGDTEEQAKEEALWIFKRDSGAAITEIENLRREGVTVE